MGNDKSKILTIPNILSIFRLCLIPLFMWLYIEKADYMMTALVLTLSGATDIVDGYVARRFNMVSDLGKALDPIADKLSQIAMLACLCTRFKIMLAPLLFIAVKELLTGIFSLAVIKKTGRVMGADWHGKLCTALLYGVIVIHVLWFDIPYAWSVILVFICIWIMLLSFSLYFIRNTRALMRLKRADEDEGELKKAESGRT